MFRNQLTALFTHERIVTTLAKAKELRPLAERMVTLAGTGTIPARRKVATMIADKEGVRTLFDDIAPRFTERPGGYTRIMRLGRRRGDGAELAIIEFVDYDLADHEDSGGSSKDKTSLLDRAKGVFGGGGAKAEDSDVETAEMTAEGEDGEQPVEEAATEPVEEVIEDKADEPVVDEVAAEAAEETAVEAADAGDEEKKDS